MSQQSLIDALPSPTLAAPSERSGDGGTEAAEKSGPGFGDLFTRAIENANAEQVEAERQARALAAGKGDIVDTMVALSRADLSLRFVVSLRNRALESYQEIMRLQV